MKKRYCLLLFFAFAEIGCSAQQVADTLFNPTITNPAYEKDKGSTVMIDGAHSNFHKVDGRFRAFANVLRKDGYVVDGSNAPFTKELLSKGKILVIANALHSSNETSWKLPTPSAFSDEEIEAVNSW